MAGKPYAARSYSRFSLGGKLNFRNSASTLVITKIEEGQRIAFTGAYQTDEISVRGVENGCKVTYSTTYQDVASVTEEEYPLEVRNRNILKNLRKTCYAYKIEEEKQREHNHLNLRGMLFRMTRGYQQPSKNNVVEDPYTEKNLYITTRNKILGTILTAVLVFAISIGLSFERGDIVPSTGLSIAESDLVSFDNAVQISIGQKKRDVEYMLSCAGKKESVDEFSYSSTEKDKNGIFVELTPNLVGLAEYKEGIEYGQNVDVYIKRIIPEKKKVKLIII